MEPFNETVGSTARNARVDPGTVRYYADKLGLEHIRLPNGQRLFKASAAAKVREMLAERLANRGRR